MADINKIKMNVTQEANAFQRDNKIILDNKAYYVSVNIRWRNL